MLYVKVKFRLKLQSTLSKIYTFETGTKCPPYRDVRLTGSQIKDVKKSECPFYRGVHYERVNCKWFEPRLILGSPFQCFLKLINYSGSWKWLTVWWMYLENTSRNWESNSHLGAQKDSCQKNGLWLSLYKSSQSSLNEMASSLWWSRHELQQWLELVST